MTLRAPSPRAPARARPARRIPRALRAARPAALAVCLVAGLALIAAASCAAKTAPRSMTPSGKAQRGMASWYGPKFHGRTTANGERYNMMDLTAAHKTLPFGTFVHVTNRANNKTIVVRINDRGPFVHGRIIDLSYAAAKVIGASSTGVVDVEVRVMDPARGEALHGAQLRLISETGVRPWTDKDYRRLAASS